MTSSTLSDVQAWVASPIVLMERTWGQVAVFSRRGPLPAGTEERLADFTDIVATAIANTEARDELRQVADEQAALRRVATLVAAGASPAEVFAAVAEEVGRLLSVDRAYVSRYDTDDMVTVVAGWSPTGAQGARIIPTALAGQLSMRIRDTGDDRSAPWRASTARCPHARKPLCRRRTDHCRGPSLGAHGGRVDERGATTAGDGGAAHQVHRAGRHRDCECRTRVPS